MDKKTAKTLITALLLALLALTVLAASTFAWFTANRSVSTSRVEAKTGEMDISLYVSSNSGAGYGKSCAIRQVNKQNAEKLMPVSTADLNTFVYDSVVVNGFVQGFKPVENEQYYYHGVIYLRATAKGVSEKARVALYFDQSTDAGGLFAQNSRSKTGTAAVGQLLNAGRLGIKVDGKSFIFSLSDKSNAQDQQARNTKINGSVISDGSVIAYSGGNPRAVKDPAQNLSKYSYGNSGSSPVFMMEPGKEYKMDVYFYLEGCDPDCSDSISFNEADLHLAFFGVLS